MIVESNHKIPITHLFLYGLIKKQATRGIYITHKDAMEIIDRRLTRRFPSYVHKIILKELEELKLIKKIGNTSSLHYEITGKEADKLLKNYEIIP